MDKKKVGIVTFHTADNYGAVLQAYALQHYIEVLGFDVKIIDFRTPNHELEHKLFREKSNSLIKTAAYRFFTLLHYCALRKRIKLFAQFRRECFNLTSHRYENPEDFLNNMEDFDCYITGSDQVFNPSVENSECYYLDFKKYGKKKIAYAPSFGIKSFTDQQKTQIKARLRTFDALSCREDVGSEFIKSLLGIDIPTVCDPVFLLTQEEWENMAVISDKKPYILVYDLNGGYNLVNYAKDVSKIYGDVEIVCMTTKTRVFYKGVKVLRNVGPREFVGLIQNALCIVTDSFHGSSFSLIFNKPLYCLIAFPAASSRIVSLMSKIGVSKKTCTYGDTYEATDISNNSHAIMSQMLFSSKQYLITALKN